ncbi:MAG: hypothetical protein LQ341_006947 [Variospora aurantia]|nr:MAG: hypothetical protein LQ341_006947 [Variospora aurantia]
MPSGVKPEFYVSTYNASQFYQPLPPKWLKARTTVPKNFEKGAKDALKALETLTDVRTKLDGFDTDQIDLLVDHKINMNAQFTPRNAFDVSEDLQLERVSRLAEVRRKLATTNYGLPNLDEVLKAAFENLILATGISRSHSFLTAHVPVVSVRGPTFNVSSTDSASSVELFFDDRTRQIRLHQSGKQFQHEGQEISFSLRDIWKASWAEHSAKVVLYLIKTEGEMRYESYMVEMKATGDARGFLQKMSGVANFKLCRLER